MNIGSCPRPAYPFSNWNQPFRHGVKVGSSHSHSRWKNIQPRKVAEVEVGSIVDQSSHLIEVLSAVFSFFSVSRQAMQVGFTLAGEPWRENRQAHQSTSGLRPRTPKFPKCPSFHPRWLVPSFPLGPYPQFGLDSIDMSLPERGAEKKLVACTLGGGRRHR